MKKNFFKKKLALTLAVALVVASFSATPASAAKVTKVTNQGGAAATTNLYVGGAKVDYSLSQVFKGNKYTWTTSNSKVAAITMYNGVVTAKAPGTAVIKCTIRNAKGVWLKSVTKTLSVKLRATSINIGVEDFELGTGETKDLNAVKTPGKSTDAVRYYSDNTAVATVNAKTGVVTGVAVGTATISAVSKATWKSKATSPFNKIDTVKVTVVLGITKAEQIQYNKVKLTFNSDVKDLKVSDFAIVKDDTKQVIAVKSIATDGKIVTLETFASMTDGKAYTLTFAGKSYQFIATDNVVASLAFTAATVPYETLTEVNVNTVDAKGIILGTFDLLETNSNLDFTITTTQGYTSGKNLLLFAIGNTAKATATYHTYKFDTSGNEIGAIKTETIITAVDKTPITVKESKYTVAKTAPNWSKDTVNTKLAIGDVDYELYFYVKNSKDVVATSGYTFESSNKDVLLVGYHSGISASIVAVAQGTAYVLVKDVDGKIVFSLPVTIVSKRELTSLVISSETVTLSNAPLVADSKEVKVEKKDQYSDTMAAPAMADISVTCLSTSAEVSTGVALAPAAIVNDGSHYTISAGKVTFLGSNVRVGTYTYAIKVGDRTRTVVVTVKAPTNDTAYFQLVLSAYTVDTTFDGSSSADKDIEIKVAGIKGGVVASYGAIASTNATTDVVETNDNIVIKKGSDVVTGAAIVTTATGTTITFKALDVNGNVVTKAAAGTYSVEVMYGGVKLTQYFVITDSQLGVSVARKADSVTAANVKDAIVKTFTFTYDGVDLTLAGTDLVSVDETIVGTSHYVASVVINVQVGTYMVPIKVAIGKTVVFN